MKDLYNNTLNNLIRKTTQKIESDLMGMTVFPHNSITYRAIKFNIQCRLFWIAFLEGVKVK